MHDYLTIATITQKPDLYKSGFLRFKRAPKCLLMYCAIEQWMNWCILNCIFKIINWRWFKCFFWNPIFRFRKIPILQTYLVQWWSIVNCLIDIAMLVDHSSIADWNRFFHSSLSIVEEFVEWTFKNSLIDEMHQCFFVKIKLDNSSDCRAFLNWCKMQLLLQLRGWMCCIFSMLIVVSFQLIWFHFIFYLDLEQ